MLHNLRLSDLDVAIIDFLWTWKLATTSMLGLLFSADAKSIAIYQRLMRLAKAQLIAVTSDQAGKCFAWVLTNTGFTIARRNLGQLAEVGYKSEKQLHDLLVTAIHLGDDILPEEIGLETFTEQQMRRYEIEDYPSWVPPTTRHRPDGYWLVQGMAEKPRVVALEVELSRKLDSDYQAVRDFYMAWKRIFRVIWFVPKAKDAKRLAKKFSEEPSVEQCYHNFVLLGDFLKSGWQAPITLGPDQGMCVAQLLYDKAMTWQKPVTGMLLLNGAKAPHKSASYKLWNLGEFCH